MVAPRGFRRLDPDVHGREPTGPRAATGTSSIVALAADDVADHAFDRDGRELVDHVPCVAQGNEQGDLRRLPVRASGCRDASA